MAYVKQEWKDEVLNGPEQYNITAPGTNINGAEITLSTPITQAGTPVTAERMNHIEEGIAGITTNSIGAMPANPSIIEIGKDLPSNANHGGAIDFHYAGDPGDYTIRIIQVGNQKTLVITPYNAADMVLDVKGDIVSNNINSSGWITLPLLNGWTTHQTYASRFCRINGVVYFSGIINPNGSASNHWGTLPAGFRPTTRYPFIAQRNGTSFVVGYINTTGTMVFENIVREGYFGISGAFPVI